MVAADYRAKARESLGNSIFGNQWMMALALCLVYGVIVGVAGSFTSGIVTFIVIGPMTIGLSSSLLTSSRNKTAADIGEMFSAGFKENFGRALLIGLLKSVFICLWTCLFVIPGIIKAYSYGMAEYIAVDHPEYTWKECIDASKELMNGNKWRLFCLDFSFIGWAFVSMLTCGLGSLWVVPYQNMARVEFYRDLSENKLTY